MHQCIVYLCIAFVVNIVKWQDIFLNKEETSLYLFEVLLYQKQTERSHFQSRLFFLVREALTLNSWLSHRVSLLSVNLPYLSITHSIILWVKIYCIFLVHKLIIISLQSASHSQKMGSRDTIWTSLKGWFPVHGNLNQNDYQCVACCTCILLSSE